MHDDQQGYGTGAETDWLALRDHREDLSEPGIGMTDPGGAVQIFDPASWLAEWEALGGTMRPQYRKSGVLGGVCPILPPLEVWQRSDVQRRCEKLIQRYMKPHFLDPMLNYIATTGRAPLRKGAAWSANDNWEIICGT